MHKVDTASVTIRDVAKRAKVGVGTVSRVLNDHPNVSDATRARVVAAIDALDFKANRHARSLSLGRTMTVAVIAPFFTIPSSVMRLRGIEAALSQSEYDMMLLNVDNSQQRERHFDSLVRGGRADAVLVITLVPNSAEIERLQQQAIPMVIIDRNVPQVSSIYIDDYLGGKMATEHLLQLGHSKIAFISNFIDDPLLHPFELSSSRLRFEGYSAALANAGVTPNHSYHMRGGHERESARVLSLDLLQQDDPPTAIFAASDTQALGVINAAAELNIRIPDELSLIGYDNIEAAELVGLTTIHQPLYETGFLGAQALLSRLSTPAPVSSVELPVSLIVRRTTAQLS